MKLIYKDLRGAEHELEVSVHEVEGKSSINSSVEWVEVVLKVAKDGRPLLGQILDYQEKHGHKAVKAS